MFPQFTPGPRGGVPAPVDRRKGGMKRRSELTSSPSLECQILSLFDLSVISVILVVSDILVEEIPVGFGPDKLSHYLFRDRGIPMFVPVVQRQFQHLGVWIISGPMNLF